MQIFVRGCLGKTVTLNVESYETICSLKRKLREKEGFGSNWNLEMIYAGMLLEDGRTLADYNVLKESTLLVLILKPSTIITQVKPPLPTEQQAPLALTSTPPPPPPATQTTPNTNAHSIINEKTNDVQMVQFIQGFATPRPATQTTPNSNRNTRSIINETNDGEYTQGLATCADSQLMSNSTYETKLNVFVHHQAKATAALSDLVPEFQTRTSSSELEDLKREMASKERELEATTSKLEHEHASYEGQIIALEAECKKTKQELMVARKEQEATISRLTHKIKVFSGQCVSQGHVLEAEIKRTRAAAYAEGLKVGKAKRLKSVKFLHHLTDASMQYFDYGFDSCQKQAEQQGFVGQLNKESALKDAPDLKGWETK